MLKINSEITTKSDVILRRGFVYKISRKSVWRSLVEDHSRSITQGRSSICFASFVLASSFGLSTSFLSALRAISFMRKRLQNQGRISRKRSTPTRPATEQTPQITAYACSTPTRPATEQMPLFEAPYLVYFVHFVHWQFAVLPVLFCLVLSCLVLSCLGRPVLSCPLLSCR